MSTPRHNDGRRFGRRFGRVTGVHDKSAVGLEQEIAAATTKQGPGDQGIAAEGVPTVELFVHRFPTTWATKLAVECFLRLGLGRQDIFVPLDQLPRNFRVEFAEYRHV